MNSKYVGEHSIVIEGITLTATGPQGCGKTRMLEKIASIMKRCEYCNNSSEVHNQIGEWLGTCTCLDLKQERQEFNEWFCAQNFDISLKASAWVAWQKRAALPQVGEQPRDMHLIKTIRQAAVDAAHEWQQMRIIGSEDRRSCSVYIGNAIDIAFASLLPQVGEAKAVAPTWDQLVKYGRIDSLDFRAPGTMKSEKVECVILTRADVELLDAAPVAQALPVAAETQRLEFMLENNAFIVEEHDDWKVRYHCYKQDEEENHIILSGADQSFATKREAIDAAIAAMQGENS